MSRNLVLVVALSAGCIQQLGTPDLGPCAAPPDHVHTYGEIGIGTCLAGPVDLRFFDQDGEDWLAVVNADPFRNFASGSLLLVDWSSVDLDRRTNLMSDLDAHALELEPYVGGAGYLADRELILVTGRYSEDEPTRTAADELFVVDVADPTSPTLWSQGESLTLEDDPQLVAVDEAAGRAYVANLTDHSISVIDTTTTPLEEVDVAGLASITSPRFFDHDDSGSSGSVQAATVTASEELVSDLWTLSWVDGTYRIWVPEEGGLERWSTGGTGYVSTGLGAEIDPELSEGSFVEAVDPFLGSIEGVPVMYFSDEGVIRLVLSQDSTAGSWDHSLASDHVFLGIGGWDAWASSPVVLDLDGQTTLYYDGREAQGDPASIGISQLADDGAFYSDSQPAVLPPDGYDSIEDPWVYLDPYTATARMWVSLRSEGGWSIGISSSDDGQIWDEVQEVSGFEDLDVAAPVVTWASGRYRMWASTWDGESWWIAESWSYDGLDWSEPLPVLQTLAPADSPPRVALQADPTSSWHVSGRDAGDLSILATAGEIFQTSEYGFALLAVNGFEADATLAADYGIGGIAPGSHAIVDGVPTLYITGLDAEGREHISALQLVDGRWTPGVLDLVPEGVGGNEEGASDPVVVGVDGDWIMYYGATGADGTVRTMRATSSDGLDWEPEGGPVLESLSDWDTLEQRPHSLQVLEDGGVRLWYSGRSASSRYRIGSATSSDGLVFTADTGGDWSWQLGTGNPGTFDDSGVRDPVVLVDGDTLHLWYSGSPDGEIWRMGHAQRPVGGGDWTRLTAPFTGQVRPAFSGVESSFSASGARSPVLASSEDGLGFYFAGSDGFQERIGRAVGHVDALFPAPRFPTPGDELEFLTRPGQKGIGVIELGQTIEGRTYSGVGLSGMRLDPERGFLYVVSKQSNVIWVMDVRDDSDGSFDDTNYLDVEAVVSVVYSSSLFGFRDVLRRPGTDLFYAAGQFPDSVVVLDLSEVVDDDRKQLYKAKAMGDLPLTPISDVGNSLVNDAGAESQARIAASGLTLAPDDRTLLVPHFRSNSLLAFDLDQGHLGEEVAWVPYLGENPHLVRLSPEGRHALVANYLGEVDEELDLVQSTLAVVDIDPESETWMEVVTWLVNQ